MNRAVKGVLLAVALVAPALAQGGNPFVGRWDFNMPGGGATWLGVTQKPFGVDLWYQGPTGNVYQISQFSINGGRLTATISAAAQDRPAVIWELDAAGDKLTGAQKRGERSTPITGVRAPALKRPEPAAWTAPEPLFNGKSLEGWEPIGNPANSHWTVQDGYLVNAAKGANLKTTRTFDDLKLHFEVNCPDDANSGFYLRGRYEVQLEYEPLSNNPPERRIGSIYGRIAPKDMPRTPEKWETFDVTLVGRTVTITRNGATIVDHQEIEGITGGALDANEGEPGPFYIQGDHTGGLKFRNITVSVPKK
jgi:hypothetical protein